uniref:GPN-loop GTPase 2 n=1 Tax=Chromera velia CCMP2878 TaxID=1169474 RepID=A0A0G4HRU2_9ALVE|mmetsp:Transcript_8578/g.16867  ORF Transcript_8578/g.16867 Transcript_8578/m.16867 type:complete len:378 (+) Transcript_8578:151-1284(+)|eukprot:Cvel_8149.t1-p1 / transcript=Cvel_8149.t1 / gene=Cvel_8149 / organism=Chromera_velia_CCMP2878 / gene_product=GPN-loop GTPase 2, putative / transcript_product=GPN-loop GTPase 2, putative / location=Cvel_scaffold443:55158-61830(+) / protein_length=377 / sequence_SO=supercontig / SO=protein_coding / is_pseudo=false
MWFGQFVIGPPGSGKTTYCHGLHQLFTSLERKHVMVNLDPANDELPYSCDIDVRELISAVDVMEELGLGPNGALVYCLEFLLENFDWLEEKLKLHKNSYLVFDCPGQVELYTHHDGMRQLTHRIQKMDARLTAVHLVDSSLCAEPQKYVAGLLVSLSGMMLLELPHVNVLSKVDLLRHCAQGLDFSLAYYAEANDLSLLHDSIKQRNPLKERFASLNAAILELIEDIGLVNYQLLEVEKKESILALLRAVDTANGYALAAEAVDWRTLNFALYRPYLRDEQIADVQERCVDPFIPSPDDDASEDNASGLQREATGQKEKSAASEDTQRKQRPPSLFTAMHRQSRIASSEGGGTVHSRKMQQVRPTARQLAASSHIDG